MNLKNLKLVEKLMNTKLFTKIKEFINNKKYNNKWFYLSLGIAVALIAAIAVIIIVVVNSNKPPIGGPSAGQEVGVYYYSVGATECELELKEDCSFILTHNGKNEAGSFLLNGSVLTLDFDAEGKNDIEAEYERGVITLTYGGAVMRMLKKVNYTVKFETNGGTAVADVTVMNGKTVAKPADPTRENYVFVGWYKDSAFKSPYTFDSDVVTSDITIYARWIERTESGKEYTVTFDLGYDDAAVRLEPKTTLGGRLYGVPSVTREDFVFHGWWISTDNDPSRLSYKYGEDTAFTEDTTLFALWIPKGSAKLEPPSITVSDNGISWDAVSGARSYDVAVTDAEGIVVFSKSTSATTVGMSFADYAAGVYKIKVIANANTGAEDNSEAYMTLVNRGLDKVGGFFVSGDSILVFDGVDKAEKYLVTVICGNEEHNHTDFDNGSSKTFSFANCPMTDEGIRFVVKAVAEGYFTSVSDEFVYKRELASVGNLVWNEESSVVSWDAVNGAEYYMVSVTCGNELHNHGFINNGSSTFVDLKECAPLAEGISVKVYPAADGYIIPAASEIKVNKTNLKTPAGVTVDGMIISWEADASASKYEISVNGTTYEAFENKFDLSSVIDKTEGAKYTVALRSVGDNSSVWSDPIEVAYYAMNGDLEYSKNTVSWNHVLGAEFYEVQVNDGEIIRVDGGVNSARIALSKSGSNTVKVRFADGDFRSDWASVSVTAYSVTFDTLGGNSVSTQYMAVGDEIDLPSAAKQGYRFVSWYNVPGGPYANGKEITDTVFSEAEPIVLYAHYTPEKFEVIYNYGLGGAGLGINGEVEYERDYVLEVPTPSEITSSFGGWFSAPYGNGVQYTDGNGKSLAPWSVLGDMELYAFWIDETLSFSLVKVNGKDVYAVSAGARISLVSDVTVPAFHNGIPVGMVDGSAFADCKTLKTVNLPATIELISNLDPFAGCEALTDINVYAVDGIGASRYSSQDGVLFENKSSGAAIVNMPMGRMGTYYVPDGITEIPESAFANSSLNKIILPTSVTKIGNDAFIDCINLTSIVFAAPAIGETEQELTIGKRAFSGCIALREIVLPSRLTEIELSKYYVNALGEVVSGVDYAFVGCNSLETISVAEGSATYKVIDAMIYSADGRQLLYCPDIKVGEVEIPVGTQSVSAGAFIGCDGITSVRIPNTVTYIGEYAFYGLGVSSVTFEGKGFSDVTIGDNSFGNCNKLTDLLFEAGSRIAVIGSRAFSNCIGLGSFNIPATVTSIRDNAFENCASLATVSFDANGRYLEFGKDVFYNCVKLTSIKIPANVSKIPGIFGGCASLSEVQVDDNSPYFTSVNGVIFSKDMTEIIYYPQGKEGKYAIPETVTTIANGVFSGNQRITELVIPNSVSYIGEEAFKGTKIGRIVFSGGVAAQSLTIERAAFQNAYFEGYDFTLPSHTRHIGEYAFSGAYYKDHKIILNEGLETLGDYAFYFPNGNATGIITIPASVVSIGKYCFAGDDYGMGIECYAGVAFTKTDSKLTSIGDFAFYQNPRIYAVDLPDSVKTIGAYAFYECRNLSTLTLSSSLEEIGAYAFAASAYSSRLPITKLTIPAGVKSIGAHAFERCQELVTVTFEGGVDSPDLVLGETYLRSYTENDVEMFAIERGNVFASCNKLVSVNLSPNVTVLGDYTFASAGAAGFAVNIPDQSRLTTIGAYCFYKARLESFTVPATVRNLDPVEEYGVTFNRLGIGEYAFAASSGYLTKITFLKDKGSYPLTIGGFAFENQDKLTAIELPARLASYVTSDGEVIAPLANGALVFYGAVNITDITVESGSRTYAVDGGILYSADMRELIFCPTLTEGEVTVPASVTKIQDYAFLGCNAISAVRFVGGIEPMTVGNYAFYGCTKITDVVLPTNVIGVGEGAFWDCKSLENITLSKNLSSFDIATLDGCDAIKNVFVEAGNVNYLSDSGVLYNSNKTLLMLYPKGRTETVYSVLDGVITIGQSAFLGNGILETVVFPTGLIEINDNAFANCSALKNVIIPNTVELIGENAFGFATALESLTFEKGGAAKLVISDFAFQNVSVIALQLPARLAIIGNGAFSNAKITAVTFESADTYYLTEIGDNAFSGSTVVSVELPSSIVTVGNGAFSGAVNIESLVFGEGLVSIGSEAFKNSSIKEIYLPASLKTLGEGAFYNCVSLNTVVFADGCMLEAIPQGAFYGCTSLKKITIPEYVKEIGGGSKNGAFYNCFVLESVVFESDVNCTLIGNYAFYGCAALSTFEIPKSVGTLGSYAFSGASIKAITIPFTTTTIGTGAFEGCVSLATVNLNTGATALPENVFKGCVSLTYIKIPASVMEIGKDCFAGTSIESFDVAEENKSLVSISGIIYNAAKTEIVCFPSNSTATTLVIPKEIVEIPAGKFEGCTNLKEVIFEEGGTTPLVIRDKAFLGCYQLRKLVLPERLVSIGAYAFKECYGLTSVNIPKNVTAIGDYAFTWCYKLYEVYNESAIENIGSKGSIKTAQPNVNIYSPTEGASILSREGDYLFATIKGVKTLLGYEGSDTEITLPVGNYTVSEHFLYYDQTVTRVIIPDVTGIKISESSAFTNCANLEYILLGAENAPSSWSTRWHSGKNVVYGYTGNDVTYTFVTNGGEAIAPIISKDVVTLPTPSLAGYVFMGWYGNAQLTGEPIPAGKYYSSAVTTLYAGWMEESEYLEKFLGTMVCPFEVVSGESNNVVINNSGDKVYFVLRVEAGESWNITTGGNGDHKIWIYDANEKQIATKDSGQSENYTHTFKTAGTYYIGLGYFGSGSGSYTAVMTKR